MKGVASTCKKKIGKKEESKTHLCPIAAIYIGRLARTISGWVINISATDYMILQCTWQDSILVQAQVMHLRVISLDAEWLVETPLPYNCLR